MPRKAHSKNDPLSSVLKKMLDGPGAPSRAEWQRILETSPSAISQWCSGRNVPRPETLLRIVLESFKRAEAGVESVSQALEELAQLSLLPANHVSETFAALNHVNVSAYLGTAVAVRIARLLADALPRFSPADQVLLLQQLESQIGDGSPQPPQQHPALTGVEQIQREFPNSSVEEIGEVVSELLKACAVRATHSQIMSSLSTSVRKGIDYRFLERAAFLTACWARNVKIYTRVHGPAINKNRADLSEEKVKELWGQRAGLHYEKSP